MTDAEGVANRLIEYRDNPPVREPEEGWRKKYGVRENYYAIWDVIAIVMDPLAEFTVDDLIGRLVSLISHDEMSNLKSENRRLRALIDGRLIVIDYFKDDDGTKHVISTDGFMVYDHQMSGEPIVEEGR